MKINKSKLAKNLFLKTSNQTRIYRFILLIFLLLVAISLGYFILRKIQVNAARQVVNNCSLKNKCDRIIPALETLVKARQSLKSFTFDYVDLQGANLNHVDFYRTNFDHANLEAVNLEEANLYRTNLGNANLKNTNLERANLSSAILIDTKNLTPTQIRSACNWEKAFYKGKFDYEYSEWIIDRQANEQFIRQLQEAEASDSKQPVDCNKWKNWSQVR